MSTFISFDKLCKDLTSEQQSEVFQLVMSYIDSIDHTYSSSIDVVCTGCKSGRTTSLLYSRINKTRCAKCNTFVSHRPPVISKLEVYTTSNPVPFKPQIYNNTATTTTTTTTPSEVRRQDGPQRAQLAASHQTSQSDCRPGEAEFFRIEIQEPLVYNPTVPTSMDDNNLSFLKPKGL